MAYRFRVVSAPVLLAALCFFNTRYWLLGHGSQEQTPKRNDAQEFCSRATVPWGTDGSSLEELFQWIWSLRTKERKVFSQNGEDGIIEAIFDKIGHGSRYFVEFGTENGDETNSRLLREQKEWSGLLLDSGYANPDINLQQETISVATICSIFHKYQVRREIDMLSVDIDMKTLDVLERILECGYEPRLVVVEYNSALGQFTSARLPKEVPESQRWDGTNFFGASILAVSKVMVSYDYSLLYADKKGVNLFFVKNDEIGGVDVALSAWTQEVFVEPGFNLPADLSAGFRGGHPQDPEKRKYSIA